MACALATASAFAVESANTVGFIDIEAEAETYVPVSVMFTDVGMNTLSLANLVFANLARNSSLQIFNAQGSVETELVNSREGWVDDNGDDASGQVFQLGDSFWISAVRTDATVTFAGEVSTNNLTVTATAEEYTPFGNGTPAPVALADITFEGLARNSSLQIFNAEGSVETELVNSRDGWVDDNGDDASAYVFQPGDAFWICPVRTDATMTIPAAL